MALDSHGRRLVVTSDSVWSPIYQLYKEGLLLLWALDSRLSNDLPSDLQKLRCKLRGKGRMDQLLDGGTKRIYGLTSMNPIPWQSLQFTKRRRRKFYKFWLTCLTICMSIMSPYDLI